MPSLRRAGLFNLAIKPSSAAPIKVTSAVEVGSGFLHGASQAGFVAGPGGLAYNASTGTLYVASQFDNSIYAIHNAGHTSRNQGRGKLLVSDPTNLHAPIGLILAPNGNLIVANSDAFNVDTAQPSELVEYTQNGVFVARHSVDPMNGGAFGLAIANGTLAAVDDNIPALEEFTFPT